MKTLITVMVLLSSVTANLAAQAPVRMTPEIQALMEAAFTGNLEDVRRLVNDGTPVNAIDTEKRTPLMFASFNGHAPVAEYLLDVGAEIDSKDSNGRTAEASPDQRSRGQRPGHIGRFYVLDDRRGGGPARGCAPPA
jgi:hypothetical protein